MPTARSTTLPRMMKSLKPCSVLSIAPPGGVDDRSTPDLRRAVPVLGDHDRLTQSAGVKTFEELWDELAAKAAAGTPDSRTVELLAQGVHAAGKKVVEEAAEAWMAAEHEGDERAAEEIAQLLYHAQVLMLAKGLDLKDVYRHL